MIGSRWVEKSDRVRESQTVTIPLALGLTGVGLALLGLVDGLFFPVAFLLIHELGRGMFHPLMDGFIYSRVGSSFKATYGSLQSMVSRFGFAVVLFVGWILMRGAYVNIGDDVIWPLAGTALIFSSAILWFIRPRKAI